MAHERRHGFLTGPVVIADGDERRDLRNHIWSGPPESEPLRIIEHGVKCILLVEKRSIFTRIVEDRFHRNHGCLMACGNGYPGRSFRRVLRELHDHLQVPLYVLADNDPAGYLLFLLITRGTTRQDSGENHATAIPDAAFLGVRTGDVPRIGLDSSVQIKLSATETDQLNELRRIKSLKSKPRWHDEFDQMLDRGTKAEMESLCTISPSYLSDIYLPERLAAKNQLYL